MGEYSSILRDLKETLAQIDIPIETGIFSEEAPDEYLVITPMNDLFDFYADNLPHQEIQEARISLYAKGNYMPRKNQIVTLLIETGFTITGRLYIGYEEDTGFFHYSIDALKEYVF